MIAGVALWPLAQGSADLATPVGPSTDKLGALYPLRRILDMELLEVTMAKIQDAVENLNLVA